MHEDNKSLIVVAAVSTIIACGASYLMSRLTLRWIERERKYLVNSTSDTQESIDQMYKMLIETQEQTQTVIREYDKQFDEALEKFYEQYPTLRP